MYSRHALLLGALSYSFDAVGARSSLADLATQLASIHWSSTATTVEYPDSLAFVDATERWTIFKPPSYGIAITPGNEQDAAQAMLIAKSVNSPFLATGGRHGYSTTFGGVDQGLAIDLSLLNEVQVDSSKMTLTVGGGVLFKQIFDPIYGAGFEIQTGSCDCPGMVGVTIGGGIGRYQGLHSLLIDALLSVRMITANGTIITVSKTSYPDLFWAIKGAGANFGIVTAATYKLKTQTNQGVAMSTDLIFPANASQEYFNILSSLQGNMPKELSVITVMNYDAATSQPQILANWVFVGPESQGDEVLAPVLALNPSFANTSTIPWNKIVTTAGFGLNAVFCVPNITRSTYSATLRNLSASTWQSVFDSMITFWEANPAGQSSTVEIEVFPNQETLAVPESDAVYPYRDAWGHIMLQMQWQDPSVAAASNALGNQLRRTVAATSGYDGLAVYVNYAHGDETPAQVYGVSKLPRLRALKETWDPSNIFRYSTSLT
ncbi:FAD-binding domain-containing protein [Nemania abortiva]|nr:FAD-binding domain-containing protein [Nemania abortiva]